MTTYHHTSPFSALCAALPRLFRSSRLFGLALLLTLASWAGLALPVAPSADLPGGAWARDGVGDHLGDMPGRTPSRPEGAREAAQERPPRAASGAASGMDVASGEGTRQHASLGEGSRSSASAVSTPASAGKKGRGKNRPRAAHTPVPAIFNADGDMVALDAVAIWRQPERQNYCAITFDDGPTPYTSTLLDALEAEGVKATFFLLGKRVPYHPDVVRRMQAAGHEVAHHSYSHPNMRRLSTARMAEELDTTLEALRKVGVKPRYFRPPYGNYDERLVELVRERDMRLVLWTTDSRDWKMQYLDYHNMPNSFGRPLTAEEMRGVFLFHDTRYRSREDVRQMIAALREDGCQTFVTVHEYFQRTREPVRPRDPDGVEILLARSGNTLSDGGEAAGRRQATSGGTLAVPLVRTSLKWCRHLFFRGR